MLLIMKIIPKRLTETVKSPLKRHIRTSCDFRDENFGYYITDKSLRLCEVATINSPHDSAVVIPSRTISEDTEYRVNAIAPKAFYGERNITEITIPGSIESIGHNAFYGCWGLQKVHIIDLEKWLQISFADNPLKYAHNLYLNGKELIHLEIPDTVTTLNHMAFYGCNSIRSIRFNNRLNSIGPLTFSHCNNLTSVEIPPHVTDIGEEAFSFCNSLTSVTINAPDLTIGPYAFSYCRTLHCATMPESLRLIPPGTFYECRSLTSINFPDNLNAIGDAAFYECISLCGIDFPSTLETIGKLAFYKCSSLLALSLPSSLKRLGTLSFSRCDGLLSATISNGNIGANAFSNCGVLKTVTLGKGVTRLGQSAFAGCISLEKIVSLNPTPPYCDVDSIPSTSDCRISLSVPYSSSKLYSTAPQWKDMHLTGEV